jgi:ankyrin repeat protein
LTGAKKADVFARFLLAQLHLDSLVGKRSPKAVYTALNKLEEHRFSMRKLSTASEAYDTAYDEAMSRIKGEVEDARQLAEQVISWVALACRPLTTLELLHALAIEIGESKFDDTNISDVEDIVSACAGLVTIDEESNVIRLVHYTTQEYFERTQKQWFPGAQASIALSCLTCLSYDDFEVGPCPTDAEFDARFNKHALYDYVARNWGNHARPASADIENEVLTFIKSKSKLAASVQAMAIQPVRFPRARKHGYSYTQYAIKEMAEIHVGALFGLERVVTTLLNEGYAADSRCSNGRTPLSFAAEKGHEEVVRILLAVTNVNPDSKADHSTYDGERTPLSFAAESGNTEIVKLLLATGCVNINSSTSGKFSRGRTPLSFAAGKGHVEVVKQLLTVDLIDADGKSTLGQSPLFFAAGGGHTVVVQLLLATGDVDADSMDNGGFTPLANAAVNGYSSIVKQLIDTGVVNLNSKTTEDYCCGFTPLMWAAGAGYEPVVELLLATEKVDVNSRCEMDGQTALMMAVKEEEEAVAKMLLETGNADVTVADNKGLTALDYASEKGLSTIVKLLQQNL